MAQEFAGTTKKKTGVFSRFVSPQGGGRKKTSVAPLELHKYFAF